MNEAFLVKGLLIGFGTIWAAMILYAIWFWWKHRKTGTKRRTHAMVRLEDIEVGDNLYFNTDSNRRGKAVVDRIYTKPGMAPAIGMKTRHSTFTVQLHNLFATQGELTEYVKGLEEKCFKERLEKIKTVEDLVRFMYDNTVSEADEYTDEDGRRIAAMKAKELLGIDLDARGT